MCASHLSTSPKCVGCLFFCPFQHLLILLSVHSGFCMTLESFTLLLCMFLSSPRCGEICAVRRMILLDWLPDFTYSIASTEGGGTAMIVWKKGEVWLEISDEGHFVWRSMHVLFLYFVVSHVQKYYLFNKYNN